MLDKKARITMIRHCQVNTWHGVGKVIEEDVDETENIYVVLKGKVDAKIWHAELKVESDIATMKAGEVFGDD